MKKLVCLLACLPALPALAGEPEALPGRIYTLQRDVETRLSQASSAEARYRLVKSQMWLDLALDEFNEHDRTGVIEVALDEASRLLQPGDARQAFDTPVIQGSEKIRPDLWQLSAALKQHPHADCALPQLARLDVQLVWAGHEKWESGWSHAKPYVQLAEDFAAEAEQEIERCTRERASVAEKTVPTPAAALTLVVEKHVLSTDALFQFDKAGVEHMAAGGQRRLAALAAELKRWKAIESIQVTGHADRVGAEDYNLRLSSRRAASVRDDLIAHGLPAERIAAAGHGEAEPLVECQGSKRQPGLIACLQPNRRVEIIVRGQKE